MNAINSSLRRGACVLATLALSLGGVRLAADPASKQVDAFPVFESYIKITGQAPQVTGSDASYARRFQKPQSGSYGIEALHLSRDLDKETAVEIDGRALTGAEDYLGKIKFTKNEVGSLEMGYKRFRTFYDGIGGFFPLNNSFRKLNPQELHTDRAKFWVGAKFERPNAPKFEFSYVNDLRNGRKDTTIWGATDFTGIPIQSLGSLNPIASSSRALVPSFINLDERQQTLLGVMKHTVGNTEFELEISNNRNNSLDTRFVNRFPGELKPFPGIPANPPSFVPPELRNNPVFGFDAESTKSTIWTYMGKFETKLSETATVFGSLSYQHASAEIGGDRQMTTSFNTAVGVVSAVGGFTANGRPPYSYTTAFGHTKENVLTGNLGVNLQPTKDLRLTLAFKGENLDMDGVNQVNYINNLISQTTGAITPVPIPAPNVSKRTEKSWVPELDVRYSGIKDLALYGTFDYRYSPGTESGSSTGVTPGGPVVLPSVVASDDNTKLNHGHYKVGANWTINQMVSLRGELFYKDHTNKYLDRVTAGDGYILGYQFHGTKLTAIVKPDARLTFTTRYVQQTGKMNTIVDSGTSYDSMDSKNHMFGETIDWNPTNQVYVQANINYVFATISTAYPRSGGTANDLFHNADNNYVNGSLITGFAIEKNTDAQLQYTYYRADNYKPANTNFVFYGASMKEYTVTLALKHKFTDRLMGSLKVGYFDSKNGTTGGFTNFRGPMAYVSIEHAL